MMIRFLLLLFSLSFQTQAEVFQWFDAQGNKHYSDKPHQGAKTFEIEKSYSFYRVKKVYDGDTILLENGQKVRLLGVNTPEVENRNKSGQAGGEEAKQWLKNTLKDKKVRLEKGVEKKDKYGRLLAHVFTEDKQHINLQLVKEGFASVSIYPPNIKYVDVLLKAEQQAEKNLLGIWQYLEYSPKPVEDIKQGSFRGWQRVTGVVKKYRKTRKNSYLVFSENFSVRMNQKTVKFFPETLDRYVGKSVEVRGWIRKRKNKYTLFVRHPSAIKNR